MCINKGSIDTQVRFEYMENYVNHIVSHILLFDGGVSLQSNVRVCHRNDLGTYIDTSGLS